MMRGFCLRVVSVPILVGDFGAMNADLVGSGWRPPHWNGVCDESCYL